MKRERNMAKKSDKPLAKKEPLKKKNDEMIVDIDDDDDDEEIEIEKPSGKKPSSDFSEDMEGELDDAEKTDGDDEIKDEIKKNTKEEESDDDEDSDDAKLEDDDSLEKDLESSAADGEEDNDDDEESDEEKKKSPVVLVPVSIRLDKEKMMEWFKDYNNLDSYVIFTTAGSNIFDVLGVDAPNRISVITRMSNMKDNVIREEVTATGYIPISNNKESLLRHLHVVSGVLVDLIFDGKTLTVTSGDDSSSMDPDTLKLENAVSMRNLFLSAKKKGGAIEAMDVVYKNTVVFDGKTFADLYSRWSKYKTEYMALMIDNDKVTARFIDEMNDISRKNAGASVVITPMRIDSKGTFQIGFTLSSMKPMNNAASNDEITIHYFSNDHPYIVTTKSGDTTMIVASTVVPQKGPEEKDDETEGEEEGEE